MPGLRPGRNARTISAREVQVGDYIEVERVVHPDYEDDFAVTYEQVIYVEPLPEALEIHTETQRKFVVGDDPLHVRINDEQQGREPQSAGTSS